MVHSSKKRVVGRGAVVKYYRYGGWHRGIVLRLLPLDNFSRAYGRHASVLDAKTAREEQVGVGDMVVLGHVKNMPKSGTIEVPPSAEEVERHERSRDTRRAGQGAYYDPNAEHNRPFEAPLRPRLRTVIVKAKRKRAR